MKNKRVKMALFEKGITKTQLAKKLGMAMPTLCTALRFELSDEEQDRMIESINDLEAEQSKCDGNTLV